MFIVFVHNFEHCCSNEIRIDANRVNFIQTIIVINRNKNQKKLIQHERMIRTVYYKNMMINAKFFNFYFHMKTNVKQIQHMIDLKIDQNFDWKDMHNQFQNRLKFRAHKINFSFRIQQCFDFNLIFQNCSNTKIRAWISKIYFFCFTLISRFRIDSLIICFSNNFFVNNLCATKA